MANGPPTEVPPPLQDIPTAKEKKYDRQLRLWVSYKPNVLYSLMEVKTS